MNFSQVEYSFDEEVDEGSGAAQVELTLSNPSAFDITVYVMTNNITATGVNNSQCSEVDSENDYLHGLYTGTFPAMVTVIFVDIPICNDTVLEEDEKFSISIVSNSHLDNVTNGSPDSATVTIVDNDGKCLSSVNLHTGQ